MSYDYIKTNTKPKENEEGYWIKCVKPVTGRNHKHVCDEKNEAFNSNFISNSLIARLKKYSNTVMSFNQYFSGIYYAWTHILKMEEPFFSEKETGPETLVKYKKCERAFIRELEKEVGFKIQLIYNSTILNCDRKPLKYDSPDGSRTCYFIVEKIGEYKERK